MSVAKYAEKKVVFLAEDSVIVLRDGRPQYLRDGVLHNGNAATIMSKAEAKAAVQATVAWWSEQEGRHLLGTFTQLAVSPY